MAGDRGIAFLWAMERRGCCNVRKGRTEGRKEGLFLSLSLSLSRGQRNQPTRHSSTCVSTYLTSHLPTPVPPLIYVLTPIPDWNSSSHSARVHKRRSDWIIRTYLHCIGVDYVRLAWVSNEEWCCFATAERADVFFHCLGYLFPGNHQPAVPGWSFQENPSLMFIELPEQLLE